MCILAILIFTGKNTRKISEHGCRIQRSRPNSPKLNHFTSGVTVQVMCSSIYVCTYRHFAGKWCPLVNVITTLYYVAIIFQIIFQRCVQNRALSLRYARIQRSGIILTPQATFVPNFISFVISIDQLASGEKLRTHSLTHLFDASGTEAFASVYQKNVGKWLFGSIVETKCCQNRITSGFQLHQFLISSSSVTVHTDGPESKKYPHSPVHLKQTSPQTLTPSMSAIPNCCCLMGLATYWSNSSFLISDIRAFWHSVLSARVPECQKLEMMGQTSMAKCKGLTGSPVIAVT